MSAITDNVIINFLGYYALDCVKFTYNFLKLKIITHLYYDNRKSVFTFETISSPLEFANPEVIVWCLGCSMSWPRYIQGGCPSHRHSHSPPLPNQDSTNGTCSANAVLFVIQCKMVHYLTTEQKVFVCKECCKYVSASKARREFILKYLNTRLLSRQTVHKLVKKI